MLNFEEARTVILQHVDTLGTESVALLASLGKVAAEDIRAPWNMPLCSNSAMDGYAVRASDCCNSAILPIIDYVPAGACPDRRLKPGTTIKIMTGAPIPEGCDSVVPFEDAHEADGKVQIQQPVVLHQHVRFEGEDIRKGEVVLNKGNMIRAFDINVLASCGKTLVTVFRQPQVSIVASGDELIGIGEVPSPGKIINSNSYSLAAAVKSLGAMPFMAGICRDNLESLRQELNKGLEADVLIISAGVSVGDRDFVRAALAELEVEQVFWGVSVKPGKALAFGVKSGKPVFALPGNPVSTTLTFEEFVRPALLKMMGHKSVTRPLVTVELQQEVTKHAGRTYFLRMKVRYENGKYLAWSAGKQDTGLVSTLLRANAIAVFPPERTSFAVGDRVQVHFLDPCVEESDGSVPDDIVATTHD